MLHVDLADLIGAAARVTGASEDLAAELVAADNRAEAAHWGWQGASAVALAAKMTRWLPASTALVSRVGDHGYRLNEAAIQHAAAEAQRALAFAPVAAAGPGEAD